MVSSWIASSTGVLELPSGRLVRGRSLRRPPPGGPTPDFGLVLLPRPPSMTTWETRWVRWPDFRLPTDRVDARAALVEAFERSTCGRVEVACSGGRGRTGTALACLAVLDGVPAGEAVAFVRDRYDARAVETPRQRRFVAQFRS